MKIRLASLWVLLILMSCSSREDIYTRVPIELQVPQVFQERLISPLIPSNNSLTEEGVALGRKLFFDPILSNDGTKACVSCHNPEKAFTDNKQFSTGVNGRVGTRNSMPLFNLAWNFDERFAWDGKDFSLESQAFEPVTNPLELNSDWKSVVQRLKDHPEYPLLFKQTFGEGPIDSVMVVKAIAQFERTLISSNSKFDRFLLGQEPLSPQEMNGLNVFMDESKGDCFHCHGSENNPLWTDNLFHNNGLDTNFSDLGLGAVTGDSNDNGKFKTPSIRNLIYTAPYMHDGRFATLEEVIDHYSEGLKPSPTISPLMKQVNQGGVQLSDQDKADLLAFLLTLTDEEFVTNPDFKE